MIQEDLAIKYQAKLMDVRDNLDKLKTLGMDSTTFESEIDKIDSSVKPKIEECYQKFYKVNDSMLEDSLRTLYDIKMNSLDKINNHITSKYEEYHKIIYTRKVKRR